MNDTDPIDKPLNYRELNFARQKPDFNPSSDKMQAMIALLDWDLSNPILKKSSAEEALVDYLKQERQKENILPVVDYHKTDSVLDALLMVDWNIDRAGEKVVSNYINDNISLFGPRIEVLLNGWLDGPDIRVSEAGNFARSANSVWFQMLEMMELIARGKPDNCNIVLLRILDDERVPHWFKGPVARALGKLKEKNAAEKIVELMGHCDSITTLSNFVEALKDLRAIEALPDLYKLRSVLDQLIDEDFKLIGNWHESKEEVAEALARLVPNQDREKLLNAALKDIVPTRHLKNLRKDLDNALAILEKSAR